MRQLSDYPTPSSLIAAKQWDQLEEVLTDLRYVEARCRSGETFDLIRDYASCLEALPELQKEKVEGLQRKEQLRKYAREMAAYATAKGIDASLPQPPDTRPALASIRRVESGPSQSDEEQAELSRNACIRTFAHFVSYFRYQLDRFPDETLSTAFNHASGGPVVMQASDLLDARGALWLRRDCRPAGPLLTPVCSGTLEGHSGPVYGIAITADGRTAVSASDDRTLRVWDVDSGECLKTLKGHTRAVCGVALTADGHTAVSASDDDRLLGVWNVDTGDYLGRLEGHTNDVNTVTLTLDGRAVVSAGRDRTLRVWEFDTGNLVSNYRLEASGLAVATASGNRIVAGTASGQLHFVTLCGHAS